ncbi:hypothetical protein ACFL4T_07305 [candidate division KSB1 bacterium]
MISFDKCSKSSNIISIDNDRGNGVQIAKWYNNHIAAISLTYDSGWPPSENDKIVQKFIIENNMVMDYEIVTEGYEAYPQLIEYMINFLIPNRFGFFGHGHTHINHDVLSYNDAYQSFKQCYNSMREMGLKPIAYGYPGGYGYEQETQQALADAGFLCGRMHKTSYHENSLIVPDSILAPENWFELPCLVMQDIDFTQDSSSINNNNELIQYLDEAISNHAFLILAYHSIGNEQGWGFFKLSEFEKNIQSIKERDFWNASINDIILYIKERETAQISADFSLANLKEMPRIELIISDGLPNQIYDQPLTVILEIPDKWINQHVRIYDAGKYMDEVIFDSKYGMISILPNEKKYTLILMSPVF